MTITGDRPTPASVRAASAPVAAKIAVVIPIPNDPDWSIFAELSEDVPIIVVDDSDGKLAGSPRANVRVFDYSAQRAVMGRHYAAIPHKSAATRNFGHYLAFREGFDVIVALDYDCRPKADWLRDHLGALRSVTNAPAHEAPWVNSISAAGFYSRGFPYEYRDGSAPRATIASGDVKLNMGVWDNILDLNGIDKVQREAPREPGTQADTFVALGNIPLCGMNTAFRAELVPAYFFLPDVWIDGWQLSRHDDIWGGYILKKLLDKRGDLLSYGRPVVEHTKQTDLQRVVVLEHYMHLMAKDFYTLVDEAIESVRPGTYAQMYADFVEEYHRAIERTRLPAHYRAAFGELGAAMRRWAECFRS